MEYIKDLSRKHFGSVLEMVVHQVFEGKGKERHGHKSDFSNQPWKHITDNVGEGFVVGQAIKKLMELRTFDTTTPPQTTEVIGHCSSYNETEKWIREALGAIVYIVMGVMYKEWEHENIQTRPTPDR